MAYFRSVYAERFWGRARCGSLLGEQFLQEIISLKRGDFLKDHRAKRLFTLWIICYAAFNIASSVYVSYQQVFAGYNPITMLSGFQLISLAAVLLFFIPFLWTVYRLYRDSGQERMCKIIRGILWFLGIWSVLLSVFTVLAVWKPELFLR